MKVSFNEQIHLSTLLYAMLAMLVCFLPHLMDVPWVVIMMAVFALSFRAYTAFYHTAQLSALLKVILVVFCLVLLRWHYGVLFSPAVLIDLLLMFYWLKVIEVYRRRDLRILMLVSLFVVFTVLLRFTELWVFPYVLLALCFNVLFMLKIDSPHIAFAQFFKMTWRLVGIAVPLSMLLFFLFPRINSPLWHMPNFNESKTGFSETLKPGELSTLAQDFTTALRVQYHGNPPKDTYWKGLVLSAFNGVSWQHGYSYTAWTLLPVLNNPAEGMVEVLLEPHQSRWLFYQDSPIAARPALVYSSDIGLTRPGAKIVEARLAYSLNYQSKIVDKPLSAGQLKHHLFIPPRANPILKAWAERRFIEQGQDVSRFVASIASYIHQEPYWYRLNPRPIGQDIQQLDRFWFSTREGYCETYASAAAFILRAAGIPSRVVVGYHGGEWNAVAAYLTLRQADAHAWVEYWQAGQGWLRFDPTAAIDKSRIDEQLADRFGQFANERLQWGSVTGMSWLLRVSMSWDALKYGLERWLLFYNEATQQSLLQSLGLSWQAQELMSAFWLSLMVIFFAVGGYVWWQHRQVDPLMRALRRFNAALRRLNIETLPSMTMQEKCMQLSLIYPHLSQAITQHHQAYEALRLKETQYSKLNRRSTVLLLNALTALMLKEKR